MAISIRSNISAELAQRRLSENTRSLSQTFEKLSSGLRINRASDDAAGLAISESLKADTRVLHQGIRNLNDGVSLLDVADGAIQELSNIVIRLKELAEQSANGIYGAKQRAALDNEAQALTREFTRISRSTSFNGRSLFAGDFGSLKLQGGFGTNGALQSSLGGSVGTGTFSGMTSYDTESNRSNTVTLGDINGDGVLDVVSAGYADVGGGFASIRLGTGDGSFGAKLSYSTESSLSNGVALSDVNNDGKLDLISVGISSGSQGFATVRLGRGDGTFGVDVSYSAEVGGSSDLSLVDLNRDGNLDLVTAGTDGSDGYVDIRFGAGDGTFGARTSYRSEDGASQALELADVNNDGNLDLVTAGKIDVNTGYATVRLGRGDGTFGNSVSYLADSFLTFDVTTADLNNDGNLDLITAGDSFGGTALVRLGVGNGTFGAVLSVTMDGQTSYDVAAVDLNDDGSLDLVTTGGGSGDGYIVVRLGNGDGSFRSSYSYLLSNTNSNAGYALAAGDINGDGVSDLVSAGLIDSSDGYLYTVLADTTSGISKLLPFSLATRAGALQALAPLDRKLSQLAVQRGTIGAFQSRIFTAKNNLQASTENFSVAVSRITDADVGEEAANLTRGKILQQASAIVLAHANLQPEIAINLLRDDS